MIRAMLRCFRFHDTPRILRWRDYADVAVFRQRHTLADTICHCQYATRTRPYATRMLFDIKMLLCQRRAGVSMLLLMI